MFMARLEKAMPVIFEHEGGYVNDPDDPGGETKYGISKRAHPAVDIKSLTKDEATEIYDCDYWCPIKGVYIEDQDLATEILDYAVNVGVKTASVTLQRTVNKLTMVLGEPAYLMLDGDIGPKTLYNLNLLIEDGWSKALLKIYRCEEVVRYIKLSERRPELTKYLKGWLNRV